MKSKDKKNKARQTPVPQGKPLLSVLDFLAEAGLLKKIKRSGWWVAGISDPESVADHCFRCAVIGYCLAHWEGVDPYQVLVMTLFNDIHEARINDLHKMGHHYIDFKAAEKRVFQDQIAPLNNSLKEELKRFRNEFDEQKTKESLVARDADILECLLQAKEYLDQGYPGTKMFFKQAPSHLKTASAKEMWRSMRAWKSHLWWQRIVKFER